MEAPSGSTRSASGCSPRPARRHGGHASQASPASRSQSNARPAASASVLLPTPAGPEKRRAGGSRRWVTARDSSSRRREWPMTLSKAMAGGEAAGFDRRPRPRLDVRLGAPGVDADPAIGLGRGQREVALAYPLVELPPLRLQPVAGAALAHPGQAHLHRKIEKEREVGTEATGGELGHGPDEFEIEAPPPALVGQRRVDVA